MGEIQERNEELRQLSTKVNNLLDKDSICNQIVTRAAHQKDLVEFHTINEKSLEKIAERMPEINRATRAFGRRNSQTTNKLMTLSMVSSSPYRKMRQCLAQIEKKREALKERIFELRREKIKLDKALDELDKLRKNIDAGEYTEDEINDKFYRTFELEVDIEESSTKIADSTLYIEGAMKEIGIFQNAYEDIRKAHNIPENWDESDFEEAEIEEHIKTAFNHGIRDMLLTGRIQMGTQEYFEQFGINTIAAQVLINDYLKENEEILKKDGLPTIDNMHDFLDRMYEMFKDEYKKVIARIGLPNLISPEFLYKERKDGDDGINK